MGGYVRGSGDSVIDFVTCMKAGAKYLNFRGWDMDTKAGHLTPEKSASNFPTFGHRLHDFLHGLAKNPDVIANISLTTADGSGQKLPYFLDHEELWPTFINDLTTMVLPNLGQGKFTGVELDFEYPESDQAERFTRLCAQIKSAITAVYPAGTLTVTTWAPLIPTSLPL
ncbi:hypothetical protein BN59_01466 [Legionella massiliensis]|uniref:GH18 domain-containing protein n=1 Tax=Legionella massiliensis TaxID=1034943 RepID=A0A078KZG9_9GAMM|nr:glycoside hydrolase family 18 protein [Legionella massiliensis]CDZ77184.1 hypothetical protein BN59_01466 [Legionella massiliensis]CEE12922.1 hypothetical protein BN1094_01466 [Legionella massiliensis]